MRRASRQPRCGGAHVHQAAPVFLRQLFDPGHDAVVLQRTSTKSVGSRCVTPRLGGELDGAGVRMRAAGDGKTTSSNRSARVVSLPPTPESTGCPATKPGLVRRGDADGDGRLGRRDDTEAEQQADVLGDLPAETIRSASRPR